MDLSTVLTSPTVSKAMSNRAYIYYRLESESSVESEDGTESIYSIQDRETDFARDDASDTDSFSDYSNSDVSVKIEVEYEAESLSENEDFPVIYSSSGTEGIRDATEEAIAAIICNSSLDAWATDVETSDNTSMDEVVMNSTEHQKKWTCPMCKSEHDNLYILCQKCFQMRCWQCKAVKKFKCFPLCHKCFKVRKNFFPSRPRRTRKRKLQKKESEKVKLDTLQSCLENMSQSSSLTNLTQDSGLGGPSQELKNLDFNKIIMPEHIKRKHRISECSIKSSSDELFDADEPPVKIRAIQQEDAPEKLKQSNLTIENVESVSKLDFERFKSISSECKQSDCEVTKTSLDLKGDDLCTICNSQPKDGIFLHGHIAHSCSCYKCAMRSWKTTKRCPLCRRKVNNVVQLFTA